MNKKEVLRTLDLASFVAIILATIMVFIFQFVGDYVVIKVAVIMYAASFAIMTLFYALKLYYNIKKTMQNDELVVEDLNKKQKAFLITKLVLSALAFIFTLVIVIIY